MVFIWALGFVLSSWSGGNMFRLLRALRLLRVVKRAKRLRNMFETLAIALPVLANVGAFIFVVVFMYAVLGV